MIFRSNHEEGFTRISNGIIRDNRLTSDGRVLLAFMLSCADDFAFSVKGLSFLLEWPERKTKRIVAELKKAGYIVQNPQTDNRGRFLPSSWDVYEIPLTAVRENRTTDAPHDGRTARRANRRTDAPHDGSGVHIRTNNIKELTNSKNEQKERRVFVPPTLEQVRAYCEERGNSVDPERFINYYTSNGWKVGRNHMKDWKASVRTWERPSKPATHCQPKEPEPVIDWAELQKKAAEIDRRRGNA